MQNHKKIQTNKCKNIKYIAFYIGHLSKEHLQMLQFSKELLGMLHLSKYLCETQHLSKDL